MQFGLKQRMVKRVVLSLTVLIAVVASGSVFAQTGTTLGTIATTVTQSFGQIGRLLIAISYLAGIGFAIAAIFKFKQHKDNPTQIPLGTPLAMLAIAIALVFLPAFFRPAGQTLGFTTSQAGGFTGGGTSVLPGQ